ncbi:hypothetical protein F5Y07DRAFT_352179 [Xylaria sp. FL0933]|nr:hypothetical protein F5Y07DRAFT_352179 [Xylaria sp. FL0933]
MQQSIIVSLIAILAASIIALPLSMISSRQLGGVGGLAGPVTGILGQVTQHIPGQKPKTQGPNGTTVSKSKGPLDSLPLVGSLGV